MQNLAKRVILFLLYFYANDPLLREIKAQTQCWMFGILSIKLLSFSGSLQLAPALTDDNIYLGLIIYATDKYLLVWNAALPGRNNY